VVQVLKQAGRPALKINQDDVELGEPTIGLTDIFKTRAEKVMFVKGDDGPELQRCGPVIDIARRGPRSEDRFDHGEG